MDQSPKDQNSETRDFSAADKGDDHDNVNLVDMELELQIEDDIHSSANFLGGAFNLSIGSKAADLRASRKPTGTAEISKLPFVNTVVQDATSKGGLHAAETSFETQRETDRQQTSDRYFEAQKVMAIN